MVSFIGLLCKRDLNIESEVGFARVYGVATVSSSMYLDKIISLFSQNMVSFAKENFNLIDPNNQSHPIRTTDSHANTKVSYTYTNLLQIHFVPLCVYTHKDICQHTRKNIYTFCEFDSCLVIFTCKHST